MDAPAPRRGARRKEAALKTLITEEVVASVLALPSDWIGCGSLAPGVIRALARHAGERRVDHSMETGTGKSTLVLSNLSRDHVVFAQDDRGNGDSLDRVRNSPLLGPARFVVGPTQRTLLRYDFEHPLQFAFLDGPHGYPFPELEYYAVYPHIETGGLLVVDDIDIPTVFNLYRFLCEEAMFECVEVVRTTAFFRRTEVPLFSPVEDGWWTQEYNRRRFPIRDASIPIGTVDRLKRSAPPWLKRAARRVMR